MKNISKLIVGILFSALVMTPSFAGELSVTGGATATFTMNGDDDSGAETLVYQTSWTFLQVVN